MNLIYLIILFGTFANEKAQYIEVEAENYKTQTNNELRQWTKIEDKSDIALSASGGAYMKLLPDTRVTHDDKLIHGVNFSPEPGLSVLSYDVEIKEAGKYYVWVKAYSSGSEDNGLHVGIDGSWPESGKRMQWCEGKNQWTWASKQRTEEVHCGEPELIYLNIEKAGKHTIQFSMREDGFAFDKFALSTVYLAPKN